MPQPNILIADDKQHILDSLRLLLKSENLRPLCVQSPAAALEALRTQVFDAALIDLNYTRDTTSGAEGLELLQALHRLDDSLPVIVMTAWGSVELAVEAMRQGAADFIEKPWDDARLLSVLRNQIALAHALKQGRRLNAENALLRERRPIQFIAESPAMREIMRLAEQVASADAAVLITGENGTGKGVLARHIHDLSARAGQPFIRVNLGGLAESLFESELFGHVKGAFTDAKSDRMGRFELADGGTLFLDEIGNLTMEQQARLLHVLEEGEFERVGASRPIRVDVRIVSATNVDLQRAISSGHFRKDLYYRLNTVRIELPPLRDRPQDIEPLTMQFLAHNAQRYGKTISGLAPEAAAALARYPWPGNVRELQHVMERAVLLAQGDVLTAQDLRLETGDAIGDTAGMEYMTLADAEQHLIRAALHRCGGSANEAAAVLGVSRSALYRRLQRYGIGD
ncbi:MAG TPA: sigma-54 dependent transcriptional regulator [Gammaproteobacteria bacterium]|nr:sigma-54 dependent transcriptional regulator [Gammaproteobacteria bacterium]